MRTETRNGACTMTWKKLTAAIAVPMLAVAGLSIASGPAAADWSPQAPADPKTPVTVTADALPTVQVGGATGADDLPGGVVWSQAMRGDTVYAGGEFSEATDPGASAAEQRDNLVAYDVTTGAMTDFDPSFNATVRAVTVSGDRLYVGGDFTEVDGQERSRIAAFDLTTGELLDFAPQVNGAVQAITVTDTTVYIGGAFGGVGNQDRGNLAAFDLAGALLEWSAEVAGGAVNAIVASPDGTRVAAGGMFMSVNGDAGKDDDPGAAEPGDGLALFDAATGAALPLPAGDHLYVGNGEDDADGAITTLAADGNAFYGAGYTYSTIDAGTVEGTFAVNWDGTVRWIGDCHGDSYSVHPQGDVVYVASHTHYCENMAGLRQGAGSVGDYPYYRGIAFSKATAGTATWEPDNRRYYNYEGLPTPSLQTWFPSINAGGFTGQLQGPWSVSGNDDYVVFGGEFTRVNGQAHAGLVRFARADIAPKEEGPTRFGADYPLNVSSTEPGKVRLSWATNEDIDNSNLTYRLQRSLPGQPGSAGSNLVTTRELRADFWNPLGMTYTDTDVQPGQTYEYRIQARDPGGLTANSSWTSVTVASTGAASSYLDAVHGDEPSNWWRFGESTDATGPAADLVGDRAMTVGAGVLRGTTGAVHTDTTNLGATFTGAADSVARAWPRGYDPADTDEAEEANDALGQAGEALDWASDVLTVEAWFRTSSATGGRIVGWDAGRKADRTLSTDDQGRVVFGVKPNATRVTIASPDSYNDGTWHHAAATLSPAGMKLYVDGAQVAADPSVTVGEHLSVGQWAVGGGSRVTGLPNGFSGDIDEVAVYKHALSAEQIAEHVAAAGEAQPNEAPTAAFSDSVEELRVELDGGASSDPDGNVDAYRWTFGDGTSSTTDTPRTTHDYENAGTYSVGLTVIDDGGRASTELTKSVTAVDSTNVAPTAAFTATGAGLRPTYDASTATDPDGTVTRWAWDFGDGRTSSSQQGRARYSEYGTYRVTLTVTDNDGATHKIAKDVTISETAEPVIADVRNQAPTADFTVAKSNLRATFTSTATDVDGTIAAYAWKFGDGNEGTGARPAAHTYPRAGTYDVTLTVTDDQGASDEITKQVAVTAPAPVNQAPKAAFTTKVSGVKATLTSGSKDADGSIKSSRWSFGDGKTGSGTRVAHSYARAGTYSVKLTVTDDKGKAASVTKRITITKVGVRAKLSKVTQRARRGRPVVLLARLTPMVPTAVRGTLKVYDGKRLVQRRAFSKAPVRITLRKLSVAKHRIRVVYTGSAITRQTTSNTVTVTVRRR